MEHRSELTPLVLLVDGQESTARSIESIVRPKGHVVLKAYTGQQALDLVGKVSPDAVLVDVNLPDTDGLELLRRLKHAPTVHATTPILMITSSPIGKAQRLEALGAGAWDILMHPLDPNELILRLDTFVRVKQEADRVRDEGLTDPGTGFYNVRGILRRTKEISADALRAARPLTCVAIGSNLVERGESGAQEDDEAGDQFAGPVAAALRHVTRVSDTIGRLGPGEFVVIAPGTNRDGAIRLADRVLEALDSAAERGEHPASADVLGQIRAGLCAIEASDAASPEDLLLRATMALRRAQADDGSFRVRSYDA